MADEERESYTIVVDADGRVSLHLDSGDALHIGRIEDYPALRQKLGDEGVLDAVRGAVGDDVNVRRAAPGETDNSADVGDGADTREFDIPEVGKVVNAFKIWKRDTIIRGETLTVYPAPPNAVELVLMRHGKNSKSVPVVDGKAHIDAETSNGMRPGLWKTTWLVKDGRDVLLPRGPNIKVVAMAGEAKPWQDRFYRWYKKWGPRIERMTESVSRVANRMSGVGGAIERIGEQWNKTQEKRRKNKKRKAKDKKKETKRKAKNKKKEEKRKEKHNDNDAAGVVQ